VSEKIRISDTEFYHRMAGEPLHEEREPLEVLEAIRQEIGPSVFAAQYQQAPIPPGGLMIDKEWIRYHSGEFPARTYGHIIIQSWDTAGKDGPRNSFSVCTTWLLLKGNYYLLDLVRGRFNYPQLRDTAIQCARQFKPNAILIEDASTGIALAQELRKIVPFVVKSIPVEMDKVNRLFVQQGKFASGRVHFPKDASYLAPLLTELLSFPQSRTSDQVDSISQALAYQHSGYTLAYVR
jgi:predicted phage terminase large subunit-like protein